MAERKSGPVKPPVIDLKARDASQPAADETPKAAAGRASEPTAEPVETPTASAEPAGDTVETTPAAEREAPRPTAAPLRRARLAMPWSAIAIAAVGGAIAGTALTYALVNVLPLPSNAPVIEDPAPRLADLDARLAALEMRLPELEESGIDTQVSLDATITQLDTGLSDLRERADGLTERIDGLAASIPEAAPAPDLGPITSQLETLDARVSAIAAGASSADAAALADNIAGIEANLAALSGRIESGESRLGELDALRSELETLRAALAAQSQTLGGADIGPAIKLPLVVSGLETALSAGRSYSAELESLRALLPDLAVPPAIADGAETGLKRPDMLLGEFRAAVPSILAGRTAQSTGDWTTDALEWAKGLLAMRPVGEIEGNTPEAVVSRLEAAMQRRDFVAAAALLAQLPEPMQAAAGTVARDIRAHATADGFVASLRAQALAPVATPVPEASP